MYAKAQFFAWLILHDRINTKDMLIRRHWNVWNNSDCVLCAARFWEDWSHLFFECNLSVRIWNYLKSVGVEVQALKCWNMPRSFFSGPCFTEIVILACWNIWKQRNNNFLEECNLPFELGRVASSWIYPFLNIGWKLVQSLLCHHGLTIFCNF
jgi:hypothetical protein